MWYIQRTEYYSALKKNKEIVIYILKQNKPWGYYSKQKSQSQEYKYHMIPLTVLRDVRLRETGRMLDSWNWERGLWGGTV